VDTDGAPTDNAGTDNADTDEADTAMSTGRPVLRWPTSRPAPEAAAQKTEALAMRAGTTTATKRRRMVLLTASP
jgi:hypothetical protein